MGQDKYGGLIFWFTVINFLWIENKMQEANWKLKPSSTYPQAQWVPSIGCSCFMIWVSIGPFHVIEFFRNRLLQHESPTDCSSCQKTCSFVGSCPQAAVPAKSFFLWGLSGLQHPSRHVLLLWHRVLYMSHRWISICSTLIFHGPLGKKNNLHDRGVLQKLQSHGSHGVPPPAPSLTSVTSGSFDSQFSHCSLLKLLQCYLFAKMLSIGAPPVLVMGSASAVVDLVGSCLEPALTDMGVQPLVTSHRSHPCNVPAAETLACKPNTIRKNTNFQKHVFKIPCYLYKDFWQGPVLSPDETWFDVNHQKNFCYLADEY